MLACCYAYDNNTSTDELMSLDKKVPSEFRLHISFKGSLPLHSLSLHSTLYYIAIKH